MDFVTRTEPQRHMVIALADPRPAFHSRPRRPSWSLSRTLDTSNAGSLLAEFIGTGDVELPVTATAFSSFHSIPVTGGGDVLTKANATVTIQYLYSDRSRALQCHSRDPGSRHEPPRLPVASPRGATPRVKR